MKNLENMLIERDQLENYTDFFNSIRNKFLLKILDKNITHEIMR